MNDPYWLSLLFNPFHINASFPYTLEHWRQMGLIHPALAKVQTTTANHRICTITKWTKCNNYIKIFSSEFQTKAQRVSEGLYLTVKLIRIFIDFDIFTLTLSQKVLWRPLRLSLVQESNCHHIRKFRIQRLESKTPRLPFTHYVCKISSTF